MKIRAPAKVNLFLRVIGKRSDGYHLLDTVMVPVDLYDEIKITRPRLGTVAKNCLMVTCDDPQVPSGKANLVYQATSLLLTKKGIHDPVRIHIRKRIPVGGGLGGGSSDAAATLLGLNRLFRLRCKRREILSLAASLGADVPFFISGRPARAKGIGEILESIPDFPRLWVVILYPGFPVSTRWVYRNLKLTKAIENTSINFSPENLGGFQHLMVNDLERVTVGRYPQIAFLKERLIQEGAAAALMAGSGSSVFGIFSAAERAKEAFLHLRNEEGVQAYLVRSLS